MDTNLRSSIDETHKQVVELAHEFFRRLVEHKNYSSSIAAELMLYATQLFKLVPNESKPQWLLVLMSNYAGKELRDHGPNNLASHFASYLLTNLPDIERPIPSPNEVAYDFDYAFEEARDSQNIPEAFDKLIAMLEQIIAADVVDSRIVQETLERLMALLKRNKHGSLVSILVTMNYARFALNAFGNSLAAVPVLKPVVEAFKKEFAEAESKVNAAEEILKKEAARRLTNQDRLIAYLDASGTDRTSIAKYIELNEQESEVSL